MLLSSSVIASQVGKEKYPIVVLACIYLTSSQTLFEMYISSSMKDFHFLFITCLYFSFHLGFTIRKKKRNTLFKKTGLFEDIFRYWLFQETWF
jgi:hypothetical protein